MENQKQHMDHIKRIETSSTIWEFDTIEKKYIRIPKSESLLHPLGGKPYEGRHVQYDRIELGVFDPKDGMQQFWVYNTGVKWGEGACTQTWAIKDQDLSWVEEEEENV